MPTKKGGTKTRIGYTSPLSTFKNACVAGEGRQPALLSTQVAGGVRRKTVIFIICFSSDLYGIHPTK